MCSTVTKRNEITTRHIAACKNCVHCTKDMKAMLSIAARNGVKWKGKFMEELAELRSECSKLFIVEKTKEEQTNGSPYIESNSSADIIGEDPGEYQYRDTQRCENYQRNLTKREREKEEYCQLDWAYLCRQYRLHKRTKIDGQWKFRYEKLVSDKIGDLTDDLRDIILPRNFSKSDKWKFLWPLANLIAENNLPVDNLKKTSKKYSIASSLVWALNQKGLDITAEDADSYLPENLREDKIRKTVSQELEENNVEAEDIRYHS